MTHTRKLIVASMMMTLAAASFNTLAAFPDKAITLIVPFSAGGPTDVVGRVVAAKASQILGAQVVVENRAGAAGAIGANTIARAKPDGYTVGLATVSTHGTAPNLYPDLPYDAVKDFTPITNLVASPNILSVHPSFPAQNLKEFVAEIKSNPGKYGYANAGAGGINDLGMIWFLQRIGGEMISVPYRGSAPALTDAVGGTVPVIFDNFPSSLPHILSGKLRALAITGNERNQQLPNVPTFKDAGQDDYDVTAWYGLVGPAGLPDDVRERLGQAFSQAVKDPETAKKLTDGGAFPVGNTPAEFSEQIKNEIARWKEVVAKGNIKLN